MKFGLREICDVVLRAKHKMTIGKFTYEKDMPVLYFDSLKTSSLEGAATTVYAQGGKGNTRLIAWEGEKTITFTMEDALISKESLAALSGAGVVDASHFTDGIPVHTTETTTMDTNIQFKLEKKPWEDARVGGEVHTYIIKLDEHGDIASQPYRLNLTTVAAVAGTNNLYTCTIAQPINGIQEGDYVLIDYYEQRKTGVSELQITADKFAGNYYLEASTLFRNKSGEDLPAEFVIPNCKIQSNFTLTMAPTGDPSTFTFTMDAFPDYTKYNRENKVLAAIQVIEDSIVEAEKFTEGLDYNPTSDQPTYQITVPSEITVTGFSPVEGKISNVVAGTTIEVTAAAQNSAEQPLREVTVNGSVITLNDETHKGTFIMPAANVEIVATYGAASSGRRKSILNDN